MKYFIKAVLSTIFILSFLYTNFVFADDKVLRVVNWTEYITPEIIPNFEKICNCKVEYIEYEVEENMLAKFHMTPAYYDVAVISTLKDLKSSKRIEKLDISKIPNYKNIDEKLRADETYTVPYLMGTVGLIYRKDIFPERLQSWKDIFEPSDKVKGKIILLNDRREVLGAALKYLGYSMNSSVKTEISEAERLITSIKPHIYKITSDLDVIRDALNNGSALVSMAYSGDAISWMEKFGNLEYFVPIEGGSFFVDKMVIFSDSPNKETAYKFVDYLLNAKVGASLSGGLYYGTVNNAAKQYIDKEILQDSAIFPPDEVMSKMELIRDSKIENFYNKAWRKIMK